MTPRVWSKRKGSPTAPRDAVYVGRPSRFGNPYKVDESLRALSLDEQRRHLDATFGQYLRAKPWLVREIRTELAGKDLVCWCAPLPCHADILLRVANGGEP